jgi:uncharacterized protein (TIGR00255 family)
MISSMTGYGQSQLERDEIKLAVEIRSVNNRFLDVQVRLPRFLQPLEGRIRELAGKVLHRGKINLVISWDEVDSELPKVSLNRDAAKVFYDLLAELKGSFDVQQEIQLEHLTSFSEIFKQERQERDIEELWPLVEEAVNAALEDLQRMRSFEGEQIHKDMTDRVHRLEEVVTEIEGLHPERVERIRQQLQDKLAALLDAPVVDEQRLAMEVALLAEKMDITEECVRFHSHNKLFLSTLEETGPVGRKLTFLLQEMNREANTMGSKANDVEVAHRVVDIKEEIERVREQVQNVE